MKLISIVTHCYNEEKNVEEVYRQVKEIFDSLPEYRYEHIFVDNASKDKTVAVLKAIASRDQNVKIIVNARNFGPNRSQFHGLREARGDAAVSITADLEDPTYLIADFIKKWEEGYKIVAGIRTKRKEFPLIFFLRQVYYTLVTGLSNIKVLRNFFGFGLYDREILDIFRQINDPDPYVRGIICEIGYDIAKIEYSQERRKNGKSKHNFYLLYEIAMLGIINYSKIPLRIAAMSGFVLSVLSLLVAIFYFMAKILLWSQFTIGMASILIGLFFFSSVQLFFIGVVGEYIGAIYTQVLNRPMIIEKERVNL